MSSEVLALLEARFASELAALAVLKAAVRNGERPFADLTRARLELSELATLALPPAVRGQFTITVSRELTLRLVAERTRAN